MKNKNTSKATTTATTTAAQTATITVKSPKGKQHTIAAGQLPKFAQRYNLDASNLRKVANGTRNAHKGWTR